MQSDGVPDELHAAFIPLLAVRVVMEKGTGGNGAIYFEASVGGYDRGRWDLVPA